MQLLLSADSKVMGWSQSDQEELFSRKRQKLSQWAHNSFPEIKELRSMGYDLISMLLSQLLPWSNEKKSCSAPVESNTKTELLACPMFDIPSKKLYWLPKRNIVEVDICSTWKMVHHLIGQTDLSGTMLSNNCSPTNRNRRIPSKEFKVT